MVGTELGIILSLILAFLGFLFCKWIWDEIKDSRKFYLKTPTLSKDELELVQNSESNDEQVQSTAQAILDAMDQEKREALATCHSLHKTVRQLAENRLWFIYKGFVTSTLSTLSRWFGESFAKPRLNANELVIKPSPSHPASDIPTIHWQQWLTLQSYYWLLLVAMTYPFMFALLNSLSTDSLNLAGIELIAFGENKPAVGYLVLLVVSFILALQWGKNWRKDAPLFSTWSWFGALLLINMLVTQPFYGEVAFAGAVALVYALERIESKGKNTLLRSLLTINLLLLLYYAGALFAIRKYGEPDQQHMLLLPIFLGILPLFNALIDWLSFNVTRLLTYKILSEKHSLIMNIGYGVFDAVLAVGFVLLVTSTVLFGLTGLNHLFAANIVDLSVLMQALGDPARISEHYWIHAMVLSTIVPTLFHLLLVCFSLLLSGVMFWKRAEIDAFLTKSMTDRNNRKGLLLYVQFRWCLVLVSGVLLAALCYWLFGHMGGLPCQWWHIANDIAQYADGLFGTLSGEQLYTPVTSVCEV